MPGRDWRYWWPWGLGLFAGVVLLLSGCGDSGSVSRRAAGLTGSTTVGEGHRDGSEAEVQGTVSDKSGICPAITFKVAGIPVQTTGATRFKGRTCQTLTTGDVVEVEGQFVGDGTILAREVKLRAVPVAAPGVVMVALVGPVNVSQIAKRGKFEFEDVPPGTYNLTVTVNGRPGCTTVLVAGIVLTGPDNEVEGRVVATGTGPCGLRLVALEVKPGKLDHDDEAPGPPPNIPRGHLPPPGSCRIWFPDRPAGHQPPPGRCEDLQHRVPPGAFLIRG